MKVALLLRGFVYKKHHMHWTGKVVEIDYRDNLSNVKTQVVEPLRSKYSVDVYLSTYETNRVDKDELMHEFDAREICWSVDDGSSKQMDCLQRGVEMIMDQHIDYDLVIISRFDLELKVSVTDIPYDPAKINFIWYEQCNDNRVGDCMHFVNYIYTPIFLQALRSCTYRTCCHYLKNYLDPLISNDDVNVIYKELLWSNSDDAVNPLYVIKRRIVGYRTFNKALGILTSMQKARNK